MAKDDDEKKEKALEALKTIFSAILGSKEVSEKDKKDGDLIWKYIQESLDDIGLKYEVFDEKDSIRACLAVTMNQSKALGRTTRFSICVGVEYSKRRVSFMARLSPSIVPNNVAYQKLCGIVTELNNEIFTGAWMLLDVQDSLHLTFRSGISYSMSEEPPGSGLIGSLIKMAVITIHEHIPQIWKLAEKRIPPESFQTREDDDKENTDYGLDEMQPPNELRH